MDAQLLQEGPSTDTSNRGIHRSAVLTIDLNIHAKNDSWFQDATDTSQHIATEVPRHFKNCVNLERQTAAGGVDLYHIRGDSSIPPPRPQTASCPPSSSSHSGDNSTDIFDLLLDISEPLPKFPPGVTWVNSCVSARKGSSHRLFTTTTTSQQPFLVTVQMYNTNDIEEVLEQDKPLLAVVSACLHLSPTSPVLKILDDLFVTAEEETLSRIYIATLICVSTAVYVSLLSMLTQNG
jgi:hypothetical protein